MMNKHVVCVSILLSLLSASLLNVSVIKADSALTAFSEIVVPDEYSTIQEAIDNAVDGDIVFVRAGTYCEHVIVDKMLSLMGEDANTTVVDGGGTGHVIDIVSDNVNFTGFTVRGSGSLFYPELDAGVTLNGTRGCRIAGNNFLDNGGMGIHLFSSTQNVVSGNNLTRNALFAIDLMASSDNIVSSNVAVSNQNMGIGMHASSHNNIVSENIVTDNRYGLESNNVRNCTISSNNLVNNSEIGIWMQEDSVRNAVCGNNVTASRCCVRIDARADSNTLYGNILMNGQTGIQISNARYTEIFNNTIAHNYGGEWDAGIYLDSAGYSRKIGRAHV